MSTLRIIILLTLLNFQSLLTAQDYDPDHQLLWRISGPELEQESYLFGTMHLRDPRVFNLSDSIYVKIEECKTFALEVHPDTMVKSLIIDPFNAQVENSIEKWFEEEDQTEELDEIRRELKEKTGLDFGGMSKDNAELLPFFLKKIFKKNKDKNTFLDAHLYHIARILGKDIIGLETLEDHRRVNKISPSPDSLDFTEIIRNAKNQREEFENLIDIYHRGDLEAIEINAHVLFDSVMIYRNQVMTNSALEHIEDGGIFMAVGAAHLPGKNGIIQLLRDEGYTVEAVKARFSKKIINHELAERDLDWVDQSYPDEGFKISTPDHPYNFKPSSMVGVMNVRSYADLGLGHFFYYSVTPIMAENYGLDELAAELRQRTLLSSGRLQISQDKYKKYQGFPYLEFSFKHPSGPALFRYIIKDKMLYSLGVSKLSGGKLDKDIVKRFFESLELTEISQNNSSYTYTHGAGAFSVKTTLQPQYFKDVDDSDGQETTTEYFSFLNMEDQLLHIVSVSSHEPGVVMLQNDYVVNDYASNIAGASDSIILNKKIDRFDAGIAHVEFDDQSFFKGILFVRGNRMYQVITSGVSSPKNVQIADEFIANFDTIAYQPYETTPIETDLWSAIFPPQYGTDTLSNSFQIEDYASRTIGHYGMDPNSGMNVWVMENDISPYATYESLDSFKVHLKNNFIDHNDSLLYIRENTERGYPIIELGIASDADEHRYDMAVHLDGNKSYIVSVIQDVLATKLSTTREFLNGFQLKNPEISPSDLLRDSAEIKELIVSHLFDADTTRQNAASDKIHSISFDDDMTSRITTGYNAIVREQITSNYHGNLLRFLGENAPSLMYEIVGDLYLRDSIDGEIQRSVFGVLVAQDSSLADSLIKSLIREQGPKIEDSWELSMAFGDLYAEPERLATLFPELLDIVVIDSSIALDYLIVQGLEAGTIKYEDLQPLHELIEHQIKKNYELLVTSKDDDEWSHKYEITNLGKLLSYGEAREDMQEIFQHVYRDTSSYYYRFSAAEILLRQGFPVDLENVYDQHDENSAIVAMYELERQFDHVNILPDSMLTEQKYAKIASLAYLEDEEYEEASAPISTDTMQIDSQTHYFYLLRFFYGEERDLSESYDILLHTVMPEVTDDTFVIPDYDKVYSYSWYMDEGETVEGVKKELLELYDSNQ